MAIKPFYNLVDWGYKLVFGGYKKYDMPNSFFIGMGVGGYAGAALAQWLSKNVIDKAIPKFDEKVLPNLEKIFVYGTPIIVGLYAYFDFDGAKEIMKTNPAYTSGMIGIYIGGIFRIIPSWGKRSKLKIKRLENKIANYEEAKKLNH